MGNCTSQSFDDYSSYYAYDSDMKKYFPADGCTIALFVDRSQSNVIMDEIVRNPLHQPSLYPPANEKEKTTKHWLPEDTSTILLQLRQFITNPSLIVRSPLLNNYLKIILLLIARAFKTAKCPEVLFYTFGGANERANQVTYWGNLDPKSVVMAYCHAVSDPRSYGRETSYQGIVDASVVVSSQIQVPLISIIISDGIVSEHCREASESALSASSEWPIFYTLIATAKSPQVTTSFLKVGKKFDNMNISYYDDIQTSLVKWNEDPAILLEMKALSKVPRQFNSLTKRRLMYNLRSDRPKDTRPANIIMPTAPMYSGSSGGSLVDSNQPSPIVATAPTLVPSVRS
jgi:hypothetical protein